MTDPQVEERASSLFWYSKLAGFRGTCAVSCYRVCRFAMSTPTKNTCCQHKHDPMIPAETSSKKKLLQCGTPVAGCLVGRSKPWRELPTETSCITWDHESWRIQGLNTPNNLRMAAFFTAFCKLVNAKEMMPDFDLEFEVDRHYLCEVGHMSHVFFFGMCVATQSQHEPQVLLKSGGQSPAPWGTHRMSSFRNIQFQWMAKKWFLVESQVEQTSHQPTEVGIGNLKNSSIWYGLHLLFLPGESMVLTLHLWQQRASL